MSNCIANELLKKGKTVLYQTAPILLENVINYKMSKQKDSLDNIYKSILDSDLLIIDDLGTESLNSMKLSELFTILNTRILNLNHKPTKTIISTNLNINDIKKEDVESLIRSFGSVQKGHTLFERLVESCLDYLDEDNPEEAKRLSDIIYE